MGNRKYVERKEQMEVQAEEQRVPPSGNGETGEQQSQFSSVDVDNHELRQSVTHVNPSMTNTSNGAQVLKCNDFPPLNAQCPDFHLNEIGVALKEFDSSENPT